MTSSHDSKRRPDAPLLLFVCSGNIARSPMAAALAERAAKRMHFELRVASAGTAALVGEPAVGEAQRALEEVGVSLAAHRAAQAPRHEILEAALTVTATRQHRDWVYSRAPEANIASFNELTGLGDIPDPYGAGPREYRAVRDKLLAGMPSVLAAFKASID